MLVTYGANSYAWAYLGRIYDEMKQKDFAMQAYENALQYQPENPVVHCCLAYHYMEKMELEICKNRSKPSGIYCENIRDFQRLFWL